MAKTKTTPRGGSKSHCPEGMAAATFAGGAEEEPGSTQQLQEAPGKGGDDSQDWLAYSEGATQGKAGTSKSKGETGDPPQQAEGEALGPPKEIPPTPKPTDPAPGTSKDPTDAPVEVPTQDPTPTDPQTPEEEDPPTLTSYVKSYKQAGKVW